MTKFLRFLFIIITFQSFGQSEFLKGKIIADSLQGYAINIINFTKEVGATNDDKGYFKIPAAPGDSIVFSSVQYQKKIILVQEGQLKEENVMIFLYAKVQELDQVKISTIELTGNLDKDLGVVELEPFVDNRVLGLPFTDKPQPTVAQRRIYTARSGVLDLPINYLSGKLKKLKRIKALEDLDAVVYQGEVSFTKKFFVNDLKLPEDLITDFIYYCAENEYFEDLLENSKRLSLVEFFKKQAVAYRKHKEIK